MPYERLSDLPGSVKNNLPKHGQEIYVSAYNNAWNQYKSAKARRGGKSREETAHSVAWAAVQQEYKKNENGDWVKK